MKQQDQNKNNGNLKNERPMWVSILIHSLIIIIVGFILVWMISLWLKHWTRHDDIVYVPDVKGMHFDEAKKLLISRGYDVELSDSVYVDNAKRGAVVDQNPKDSTTVRSGRTIYLTVNAFYPRMVSIPVLTDISVRQAKVSLEGIGIKNIIIKEIPSDYKDLVHGALWNGKRLTPGTRVPLSAKITLEVGKGATENDMPTDSLTADGFDLSKSEIPTSGEHEYFD